MSEFRIVDKKKRFQLGTNLRLELFLQIERIGHFYGKWWQVQLLPSLTLLKRKGNRAHLEPNTFSIHFGWITTNFTVWFSWPYQDKYCDIAYRTKAERGT